MRLQVEWGVRVDELHQVSASAPYIHPAVAKKLQDLWDEGSNLLSLLDDRCAASSSASSPATLLKCCWSPFRQIVFAARKHDGAYWRLS